MTKSKKEYRKTNLLSQIIDNKFFYLLKHNIGKVYLDALKGVETVYALEIDSDNLRLLKATRKDDRILKIDTDNQPIQDLSKSINTLFSRNHYNGEKVFINITGIDFLNKIVEISLEKNQTVQDWIIKNKDNLFPPAGDEEIEFDYVLSKDDQRKLLYVSIGKKDKLDQLRRIFKENHLNVVSLSSGSLFLYQLLRQNDDIAKTDKLMLVLLKDRSVEITFLNNGIPIFVTISGLPAQMQELVTTIKNLLQFSFHGNEKAEHWKFLVLDERESYIQAFREAGFDMLEQDQLQKHLDGRLISSKYMIPFSLVVEQGSIADETSTDFLSLQRRVNDRMICRVFSYAFRIFLLVFVVFGAFNLGFAVFDSFSRDKVRKFESRIQVLSDLKQENQTLESKWGALSQIFLNRSGKSRLLYLLGKYSPQGIWLRSINSETSSATQNAEIAGLSSSQADVSNFLRNLEQSNLFENIKIVYLEKVDASGLDKLPGKYKTSLYKFKIQFKTKF